MGVQFQAIPSLAPVLTADGAMSYAAVGTLTTTDLKRNSTHIYSFAESGGADNDKFEISDDTIVPGPYDFTAHASGTTFTVRVRTTDAIDLATIG